MKRILLGLALLSLTSVAFAQKKTDYKAVPALVKEAKKKGNVKLADSLAQDYISNYLFKLKKEELMDKDNLLFISRHMNTTECKAFTLFLKQKNKINSVLGVGKAEYAIKSAIAKQCIPKDIGENYEVIDWDKIEHTVTTKFGDLGLEMVYGKRMAYYMVNNDWNNFGKYYVLYFEKALKRPEYYINNISWAIFENINDPKVLKFACDVVMKYSMETWYQNEVEAYDTYANLLYKTGKKEQAIEWEEKAIKLAKGNEYLEKQFSEVLEKMQKDIKTWPETVAKL